MRETKQLNMLVKGRQDLIVDYEMTDFGGRLHQALWLQRKEVVFFKKSGLRSFSRVVNDTAETETRKSLWEPSTLQLFLAHENQLRDGQTF